MAKVASPYSSSINGVPLYPTLFGIPNGAQDSEYIDMSGTTAVGLFIPPTFTGTSISFKAAQSQGGTLSPVKSEGAALSYAVVPGDYVVLRPQELAGIPFLVVTSNAAEAAARTLALVTRTV